MMSSECVTGTLGSGTLAAMQSPVDRDNTQRMAPNVLRCSSVEGSLQALRCMVDPRRKAQ